MKKLILIVTGALFLATSVAFANAPAAPVEKKEEKKEEKKAEKKEEKKEEKKAEKKEEKK